jgi:hypothetical protein
MGVMTAYCQICGLPVTKHHYLMPYPGYQGMMSIYRGIGEPGVEFGPKHDWLEQAIAVRRSLGQTPEIVEGQMEDATLVPQDPSLQRVNVLIISKYAVLHKACWEMAGKPTLWTLKEEPPDDPQIGPYKGQMFDYIQFFEKEERWILVDPRLETEEGKLSHGRILQRIEEVLG